MTEQQIIDEILRYIDDNSYNYAVLIDGEWGCGKTYFAKNSLTKNIELHEKNYEKPRAVKYISIYGCKNVSDIQENIAWNFAENAQEKIRDKVHWQSKADTIAGNVVNTSRRIGNIILKKYLPETNIYEIAAEWLDLGAFIFIVDDLERCECPINEVFGFFNELVEHENTKVIILANESEIIETASPNNVELQYQLSVSHDIDWPKEENYLAKLYNSNTSGKISLEEMERRRNLLFPQKESNSKYKKIREKLVGETLRYDPDLRAIIGQMIQHSSCAADDKEALNMELDYYCTTMKNYKHCNLRTFQFFISKVAFLLEKYGALSNIQEDYRGIIRRKIIEETFHSAVVYKADYKPVVKSLEWLIDNQEKKSTVIKEYVENGQFLADVFYNDVIALQDELMVTVQNDDPFNKIYHEYYYHTQEWCEEEIEKLLVRLEADKYPISMYPKIIIAIQRMLDLGFENRYMNKAKEYMLANINNHGEIGVVDSDIWYVDDSEFKERVQCHMDDIMTAIVSRSSEARSESFQELLQTEDWVDKLQEFINPNNDRFIQDKPFFSKADVSLWVNVIHMATPDVIDKFRNLLDEVYPRNVIRKSYELDKDNLKEVYKALDELVEDDLIKKASIGWLKFQFGEIIHLHEPGILQDN